MFEQFLICIDNGANAISLSEEWLYPWLRSPELAQELDSRARRADVTITAGGHQDGYWVGLAGLLMGTAQHIDAVCGRATWNPDDYGPVAAEFMPIDLTPAEFADFLATGSGPPSYGDSVLGALASHARLTPKRLSHQRVPVITDKEILWRSLERRVPAGRTIGFTDVDRLETEEGPELSLEMSGKLYDEHESDINEWTLQGEPSVTLAMSNVPSHVTTCTGVVNRVPDVINAAPGFVTVDRLPALRYRSLGFGNYIATK